VSRRGRGEGSIWQRQDGRWEARVDLGYLEGRRRRKALYGATQREVREKLTQTLRDKELGVLRTGPTQTIEQFLETWLISCVGSIRPKTARTYEQLVRVHLVPGLGRYRLDRLSPEHVSAFLNSKLRQGLSPQTVAHLRSVLRTALNRAARWGLVGRNVAALTDPPHVRRHEYRVLDQAGARRFLDAVSNHRLQALFTVAVALGLRQGEALGLRWEDVDLDRRELRVTVALQRIDGELVLVEPKTMRSRRTIRLPAAVAAALREHRSRQVQERLLAGSEWRDHGLVFTTRLGEPLDGTAVTKDFQRCLAAAGLQKMRFHELRHSAASLMLAQGLPLRTVMEVLGHSTITLTANTYSHLLPSLMEEAADAIDRALGSAESGA